MAIIALTDPHGRYDCLVAMRDKLREMLPGNDHTLITLGDYVDRGPQSKEVVEAIISGTLFFTFAKEVIPLRGNHEDIFLEAIKENRWDTFLNNGGDYTMASFLGCLKDAVEGEIWPTGTLKPTDFRHDHRFMPTLRFFEGLKYFHKIGKYFFVHAGVNPFIPIDEQIKRGREFENLFTWVRDFFLEENNDQGYTVVHGHTPHAYDYWRTVADHRVNLDSGASYSGLLSAIVIHDPEDRKAYEIVSVKLPGKRQYFTDD